MDSFLGQWLVILVFAGDAEFAPRSNETMYQSFPCNGFYMEPEQSFKVNSSVRSLFERAHPWAEAISTQLHISFHELVRC